MSEELVVTVSTVVQKLKQVIEHGVQLQNIWIQGEISNLTKHANGYYYFSLKDERARIECVIQPRDVSSIRFNLEEGMKILVTARANVFLGAGKLQLMVFKVRPDGIGELALRYEQLKRKLGQEGYFDDTHKINKPSCIGRIAIISSKDGDGTRDVISKIRQRWPMMEMHLYQCYVQGPRAAESMIIQLKKADQLDYDAILLVRGGGSYEDLFSYNDEELIKTIYHCKTYIVDGVGHKRDTTLCDYVCDYSAITPTAAAEWVSMDYHEILNQLTLKKKQFIQRIYTILDLKKKELSTYQAHPYLQDPSCWMSEWALRLDAYQQFFDTYKDTVLQGIKEIEYKKETMIHSLSTLLDYEKRSFQSKEESLYTLIPNQMDLKEKALETTKIELIKALEQYIKNQRQELYTKISLLDAYSPLKVMERGYSLTYSKQKIIKSINEINENDLLETKLIDGIICSKVIKKREEYGNKNNEISRSDESLR